VAGGPDTDDQQDEVLELEMEQSGKAAVVGKPEEPAGWVVLAAFPTAVGGNVGRAELLGQAKLAEELGVTEVVSADTYLKVTELVTELVAVSADTYPEVAGIAEELGLTEVVSADTYRKVTELVAVSADTYPEVAGDTYLEVSVDT
jgi:hypothetical protein